MKQHYDNLDNFISIKEKCGHGNLRYARYEIVDINFRLNNVLSEDDKLVLRATYIQDIPPLKSKLDYKNILDFRVHIMLINLQNELKNRDLKYDILVYEWIKIRRINILNRMNQIRVNFNYKEPFDI